MIGAVRPAAQAVDHLEPVDVRQPEVEDDHVRGVRGSVGQRMPAVRRRADLVPTRRKGDPQGADAAAARRRQ